jgi:hypothetical protein
MMRMMTKGICIFMAFLASFALLAGLTLAIQPTGANWTASSTTGAPADDPESHAALAGNSTFLDVTGIAATQSWQGYYGNVSGTIQLADASDEVLYNWSVSSPTGEVYATENGTGQVTWSNIDCFDVPGNNTVLETRFNISTDDVDGVNETFSDANTHVTFYTANTQFTAGQCAAAYMYDETGTGTSGLYEEVLLTDKSANDQVIFAALLEEDETGFDDEKYDFEMIVLEDGHGADVSTTPYYFYIELDA